MRVEVIKIDQDSNQFVSPSAEALICVECEGTALGFKLNVSSSAPKDAAERILRRMMRDSPKGQTELATYVYATTIWIVASPDVTRALSAAFSVAGCMTIHARAIDLPSPFSWASRHATARPAVSCSNRRLRVLIVDDSASVRKLLESVLAQDPALEVVGSIEHPRLVEKAVQDLRPDVVTLDIHMPEMNGVELLKLLLSKRSLPVVMISSLSLTEGGLVLDALEAGAVDYVQKPSFAEIATLAPIICEKVRKAASARVHVALKKEPTKTSARVIRGYAPGALIAIGASTGGTEALKTVLTAMPFNIPPILIVQHIPAIFSRAFADRMNDLSEIEVREAKDGDEVLPSLALVAPGGTQMRVQSYGGKLRVVIDDSPPVNRHKPSVDALFDSIADLKLPNIAAAILTGMGADGAKGLLRLREGGAKTVAQDEATCVVYGMPRAAALIGAAEKVAPLDDIAALLLEYCVPKQSAA